MSQIEVHEKIGRPVFGRSSNGGFWPKKVRNTLSFKARHSLRRSAVLPRTRSFEPTAKNEFRYKTVADSPAMLPLVTAQTVASERGVGGRIFAIPAQCRQRIEYLPDRYARMFNCATTYAVVRNRKCLLHFVVGRCDDSDARTTKLCISKGVDDRSNATRNYTEYPAAPC